MVTAPPECSHGHVLRYGRNPAADFIPGRVLVGWKSCLCPEARTRGAPFGHRYVMCSACLDEGRETTHYDPPCSA